ncbi:aromatic compound dioxygenase [Hymenopellis radicata]|nr:aromatic compound dioxygenase [Hymenopellis radicata]
MVALTVLAVAAATLVNYVAAHAGPAPSTWRRDNLATRDDLEKRCGAELYARRLKRSLDVTEGVLARRGGVLPPRQTSSNDSTCFVTPEVTQGPYHILGEIVRQNITEDQPGIPLEVNIDFFDITTCEPIQVWVDSWHANATGYYAGYVAQTGGVVIGGFPGGGGGNGTMSLPPVSTATESLGPYSGADDPSAAAMLNTVTGDNSTFLRGVWQTDTDGHITVYSIYPGWYTGRSIHYHIKAYPEGEIADNGTFIATGGAVHTGQFFFDNETSAAAAAAYPYTENAIDWEDATTNEEDMWYPYQAATGYNAMMDITWVGEDITDGLIGTIAVGLNLTYASPELSTQYAEFDVEGYYESSMLPSASPTESSLSASATCSESEFV